MEDPAASGNRTDQEMNVERLVAETLAEVEFSLEQSRRPASARVMYAWETMYNCLEGWGVVPILGQAIRNYGSRL